MATISIRGFINTFLLRVTVDRKTTFDVRGLQKWYKWVSERERERASRFKFDFYEQSWAYICAITGFRRRSAGILSENANSSPFTREMRYASKISLFFSFFSRTAPLEWCMNGMSTCARAKNFFPSAFLPFCIASHDQNIWRSESRSFIRTQ